ncbi:hypoxanthine phosphoribosyltransferase [Trichococcus pasteurii]|uniref:Hypoxanthine phosphoribosyltransferase n=1 Tax=Trichococcus pasteurii TaxID=43064 RepID=A0A1W1IEE4_9LACT|nr:hypoxanthine phosphoribosyltransferase [Trichococcus pasteurii]SFE11384.1 hypoxanthine phosphoribosyltransferase [Trichococcus pasteurii]SLM51370.1 hypoxanthine phosphoribosyl transferase [Trichococcus pasteurii]SSB92251.1 hypoxanthine phosphoribosyl transferase [Trichococcus pasteurii]
MLHPDIKEVLYSEEEISAVVKDLGAQLTKEYEGKNPLVIGVLKGAVMFMTDLSRAMNCDLELDFMDVSSYGAGMESSGDVKILKDLDTTVDGRDLLIVEDIIDTGRTLSYLIEIFKYRKAKSIKVVTLMDKKERRVVDLEADYIGINVPNEFVVGYGLDFNEKYRNLPYIGILKTEVYE